jgi:predicted AlkP superfamily pyrophosphatase or phosphodiesterase
MAVRPAAIVVGALALGLAAGACSSASVYLPVPLMPGDTRVPGDRPWTSTGIELARGQKLLIEEVASAPEVRIGGDELQAVSARGTYLFDNEQSAYPLEPDREHDDRRYPGYCLIARVGENGVPFYVGSHFQGLAQESGTLWLGINDPDPQQNVGGFVCRISEDYPDPPEPKPTPTEAETKARAEDAPEAPPPPVIKASEPPPTPADANVVIFFVDGLRPDVVMEMAEWGHMPNFREIFVDNGTWVRNSFAVQPSLTLINFASIITGTYADRHGVKSQAFYDREDDEYINGLSDQYFPIFAAQVKERGVKAIYDYFPDSFAAPAMPFEPLRPNILQLNLTEWLHRAISVAGWASNIRWEMDAVQTRYALDIVSTPQARVTLIWLPSNDTASEHTPHGQFGGARQTIARMDGHLGEVIDRLKIRHRFESTYFILVSDHGHAGGHDVVNQRFDVKREVFHAWFQMNVISMWQRFDYPGAPEGRLGAVSDCDGAVGIFLPRGNVDSGDLSEPDDYEALSHYGLADGSRVNAVEYFAEYSAAGRWPLEDLKHRPVDFAVAKVDADSVLLYKTMDRQALIHVRRNAAGVFEYRYEPVRDFEPGAPTQPITSGDPLGYLDNENFAKDAGDVQAWLAGYHTGTEWLQATCRTEYPACVDTLALYFRWDGPTTKGTPIPNQPSILLFSSLGWVFEPKDNLASRTEPTIGSRHGMAFRATTNNSMFVSGPGIRKGTILETPHRIVDIMPTVLEMMGQDSTSAGMDGKPMRELWEATP